jgi:hypothetical protein
MHPAAKLQFEKIAQEYTRWRSVPEHEQSPAPAWWWGSAMPVTDQHEMMTALLCNYGSNRNANVFTLAERVSPQAPTVGRDLIDCSQTHTLAEIAAVLQPGPNYLNFRT